MRQGIDINYCKHFNDKSTPYTLSTFQFVKLSDTFFVIIHGVIKVGENCVQISRYIHKQTYKQLKKKQSKNLLALINKC